MQLGLSYLGVFLGVGLALIGASYGIGRLSASALEGLARQPEAAGPLQTMMIIPAAMIEGMGLLALVIALLAVLSLNKGIQPAGASSPAAAAAEAR